MKFQVGFLIVALLLVGVVGAACVDSDEGREYFLRGTLEDPSNPSTVYEQVVDGDNSLIVLSSELAVLKNLGEVFELGVGDEYPFGSAIGVVEEIGFMGLNSSQNYIVSHAVLFFTDSCNGSILREYYCNGENTSRYEDYDCEGGCSEGACVVVLNDSLEDLEVGDDEEIEEELSDEGPEPVSEVVEVEQNDSEVLPDLSECVTGLRNATKYCSIDEIWEVQKEKEGSCDNNFECVTNVCVGGECISEGLLKRFLNWLSRLFG
jgi:hypothetical protein